MEPIVTFAAVSWTEQHWRAIAGAILAAVLAVTGVLALLAGAAASMFSGQAAEQLVAHHRGRRPGPPGPYLRRGRRGGRRDARVQLA